MKNFIIYYDEKKLNAIDAYCKNLSIARVEFYKRLADERLSENKESIVNLLNKITSSLDNKITKTKI